MSVSVKFVKQYVDGANKVDIYQKTDDSLEYYIRRVQLGYLIGGTNPSQQIVSAAKQIKGISKREIRAACVDGLNNVSGNNVLYCLDDALMLLKKVSKVRDVENAYYFIWNIKMELESQTYSNKKDEYIKFMGNIVNSSLEYIEQAFKISEAWNKYLSCALKDIKRQLLSYGATNVSEVEQEINSILRELSVLLKTNFDDTCELVCKSMGKLDWENYIRNLCEEYPEEKSKYQNIKSVPKYVVIARNPMLYSLFLMTVEKVKNENKLF